VQRGWVTLSPSCPPHSTAAQRKQNRLRCADRIHLQPAPLCAMARPTLLRPTHTHSQPSQRFPTADQESELRVPLGRVRILAPRPSAFHRSVLLPRSASSSAASAPRAASWASAVRADAAHRCPGLRRRWGGGAAGKAGKGLEARLVLPGSPGRPSLYLVLRSK
jgi:hypothetical protein